MVKCSFLTYKHYLYFFLKQLAGTTPMAREIKSIDNYYVRQHKNKLVGKMCVNVPLYLFKTACRCNTLIHHLAKSAGLGKVCDRKI
jgi:hypothetical protein